MTSEKSPCEKCCHLIGQHYQGSVQADMRSETGGRKMASGVLSPEAV